MFVRGRLNESSAVAMTSSKSEIERLPAYVRRFTLSQSDCGTDAESDPLVTLWIMEIVLK